MVSPVHPLVAPYQVIHVVHDNAIHCVRLCAGCGDLVVVHDMGMLHLQQLCQICYCLLCQFM